MWRALGAGKDENTNPRTMIQSSAPYDVRPMRLDTKRMITARKIMGTQTMYAAAIDDLLLSLMWASWYWASVGGRLLYIAQFTVCGAMSTVEYQEYETGVCVYLYLEVSGNED